MDWVGESSTRTILYYLNKNITTITKENDTNHTSNTIWTQRYYVGNSGYKFYYLRESTDYTEEVTCEFDSAGSLIKAYGEMNSTRHGEAEYERISMTIAYDKAPDTTTPTTSGTTTTATATSYTIPTPSNLREPTVPLYNATFSDGGSVVNIRVWNDEFINLFKNHYPGEVEIKSYEEYTIPNPNGSGTLTVKFQITSNQNNAYQVALDTALIE